VALSQRFPADNAASRRKLEAGARRRLRLAGRVLAPRHRRWARRSRPPDAPSRHASEADRARLGRDQCGGGEGRRSTGGAQCRCRALGRDPAGDRTEQALRRYRCQ
jgi:hypothetical protein